MKIIGITGNIGSGKSTVEKKLSALLNIPSIDTDAVARKVAGSHLEIIRTFSPHCVKESKIDYDILFTEVFFNKEKIRQLNRRIHPLVEKEIESAVENFRRQDFPGVVISSALFFEARIKTDFLIVVDCPEQERLRRVLKKLIEREKDFVSARKIYSRAKRLNELQFPSERMRYYCDWVIKNDGEIEKMEKHIRRVSEALKKILTEEEKS